MRGQARQSARRRSFEASGRDQRGTGDLLMDHDGNDLVMVDDC